MSRCLLLLAALWAFFHFDTCAHAGETFARGVTAFENKEFSAARDAFQAVINQEQTISADLCFNLGNTFFRLDDPGTAALWYQRALLLNPRDPAAQQNLRLIRRRTGALQFAETTGIHLAAWHKHRHWQWIFTAAAWTAAVALAALAFLGLHRSARGWAWGLLILSLGATVLSAWGFFGRLPTDEVTRRAVVVKTGVTAHSAPTETAGVIIDLPPGSEVAVREARDTWSYVEIPGEPTRVGWVKRDALAPLWPYSATLVE